MRPDADYRAAKPLSRTRIVVEPISGVPPATPVSVPCSAADHIAAMTRLSRHRYATTMRFLVAALTLKPILALADITGSAKVIDSDTIEVSGRRIRLHGIVAVCHVGGQDLNSRLVAEGIALA